MLTEHPFGKAFHEEQHPRVAHGEHGGEFTTKPGGALVDGALRVPALTLAQAEEAHAREGYSGAVKNGLDVADYRYNVREKMRERTRNAPLRIRVPRELLPQIVKDGRLKNQHETGQSHGWFDPGLRAEAEDAMWGEGVRPIYGYLGGGDRYAEMDVESYGDAVLTLKPHVRARTTVTFGDSLNDALGPPQFKGISNTFVPSPVDDPSDLSIPPGVDYLDASRRSVWQPEIQVIGGVSLSDIAEVSVEGEYPDTGVMGAVVDAGWGFTWAKNGVKRAVHVHGYTRGDGTRVSAYTRGGDARKFAPPKGATFSGIFPFGAGEEMISLRHPDHPLAPPPSPGFSHDPRRDHEIAAIFFQGPNYWREDHVHIKLVLVQPEWRKQKIGLSLIEELTRHFPPEEFKYTADAVGGAGEALIRAARREGLLPEGNMTPTGEFQTSPRDQPDQFRPVQHYESKRRVHVHGYTRHDGTHVADYWREILDIPQTGDGGRAEPLSQPERVNLAVRRWQKGVEFHPLEQQAIQYYLGMLRSGDRGEGGDMDYAIALRSAFNRVRGTSKSDLTVYTGFEADEWARAKRYDGGAMRASREYAFTRSGTPYLVNADPAAFKSKPVLLEIKVPKTVPIISTGAVGERPGDQLLQDVGTMYAYDDALNVDELPDLPDGRKHYVVTWEDRSKAFTDPRSDANLDDRLAKRTVHTAIKEERERYALGDAPWMGAPGPPELPGPRDRGYVDPDYPNAGQVRERVDQLTEWAKKTYPHMQFQDTTEDGFMWNPGVYDRMLREFHRLSQDWPGVTAKLRGLKISTDDFKYRGGKRAWAHFSGRDTIAFNGSSWAWKPGTSIWGQIEALDRSHVNTSSYVSLRERGNRGEAGAVPFHPWGTDKLQATMTHEYGHAFDAWLEDQRRGYPVEKHDKDGNVIGIQEGGASLLPAVRGDGWGTVGSFWQHLRAKSARGLSGYARANNQERVAEAFSSIYWTPEEKKSSYVKRLEEARAAGVFDPKNWLTHWVPYDKAPEEVKKAADARALELYKLAGRTPPDYLRRDADVERYAKKVERAIKKIGADWYQRPIAERPGLPAADGVTWQQAYDRELVSDKEVLAALAVHNKRLKLEKLLAGPFGDLHYGQVRKIGATGYDYTQYEEVNYREAWARGVESHLEEADRIKFFLSEAKWRGFKSAEPDSMGGDDDWTSADLPELQALPRGERAWADVLGLSGGDPGRDHSERSRSSDAVSGRQRDHVRPDGTGATGPGSVLGLKAAWRELLHPRDEHGRFAHLAGAAAPVTLNFDDDEDWKPRGQARFESAQRRMELNKVTYEQSREFPHLFFNYHEDMDPANVEEITKGLKKVREKYPFLIRPKTDYSWGNPQDLDSPRAYWDEAPGSTGRAPFIGISTAPSKYKRGGNNLFAWYERKTGLVKLNQRHWRASSKAGGNFRERLKKEYGDGWFVKGNDTPAGLVVHEVGHAMAEHLRRTNPGLLYEIVSDASENPPSIYARRNENELFAETFASMMSDDGTRSIPPAATAMKEALSRLDPKTGIDLKGLYQERDDVLARQRSGELSDRAANDLIIEIEHQIEDAERAGATKGVKRRVYVHPYSRRNGERVRGHWREVYDSPDAFQLLRDRWAEINLKLLPYVGNPDDPEAKRLITEQKSVTKAIHHLNLDRGRPQDIGKPGGPHDVVIVGAGPAGLSAAIYGATEGLDTLMLDAHTEVGGQAGESSRIENVLGFPAGVKGDALARQGLDQAQRVGAKTQLGVRVTRIERDPKTGYKKVYLDNGKVVEGRTVILAGGVQFKHLNVPGADIKDVVYGDSDELRAKCDGGPVVIVGAANSAGQAAIDAAREASEVNILVRSGGIRSKMSSYLADQIENDDKMRILNGQIQEVITDGHGHMTGVLLADGTTVTCNAMGVFIGSEPKVDYAPVERDARGYITVGHGDDPLQTSMPGVYAAGDVRVGATRRVITAAADGAAAIAGIHEMLIRLATEAQMRDAAHGKH